MRSRHLKSVYIRDCYLPAFEEVRDYCLASGRSLNSLIGCFLVWFSNDQPDEASRRFKADLMDSALFYGQREMLPIENKKEDEE